MFIVMHCGGIPFNGDTIKTKSLGGSESAAYYVARELVEQGHNVTLFTNSEDTGTFDGVKYEWAGSLTESAPLGERFTFYAENTPHDILIIQRHPMAFGRKYASKINFWWLHDLSLYRTKELALGHMWNIDKILCVSEYHRNQIHEVWGIPKESIVVIRNGVDLMPYLGVDPLVLTKSDYHMFYSSRPERGLINLVKAGGIMDQLRGERVHLHVCGYENTTDQMRSLYEMLWQRCEELPNVTNHGSLTKLELAALQKACDAWIYPTDFEEVSCITAMEAMAADCDIIASSVAALPETCATAVCKLIGLKNGEVDDLEFVNRVLNYSDHRVKKEGQRKAAKEYSWANVAYAITDAADQIRLRALNTSLAHHFIRHSDIKAYEAMDARFFDKSEFNQTLRREFELSYKFYRDGTYADHYKAFYQYEKDRGVNYGPEDVTGTSRFQAVSNMVSGLPSGARVLDYGCAHGHYTVALAHRFPSLTFVGADLAASNVEKARAWAETDGLTNVKFLQVSGVEDAVGQFDFIIAAEVIEHVGDPQHYVDTLSEYLTAQGRMVITVPYGPWEAQGYREHKYWRAHLHHFERQDLKEMLGHHPKYAIVAAPSGSSTWHTPLGSYIVSFNKPVEPSRPIDYHRKIAETVPDQTVSCCMIVKNGERDLRRCLESVLPHVQEVIIGVDSSTTDRTHEVLASLKDENPLVAFTTMGIPPATETGFAEARNATISHASGDWILWIDSDEVLVGGAHLSRYTRNSMYNGMAIKQHHFSNQPIGVVKVDLPCRLFRNGKGVRFFGVVHEHPEIKLNEGLGPVSLVEGVDIIHYGYTSEAVRRGRFARNLPLLARDRKELPDRVLGKFLWLRDLAQGCQYDIEENRADPSVIESRISEGLELWKSLVKSKNWRIIIDALPYYSQLVMMRGGGVDLSFVVDASVMQESSIEKKQTIHGHFATQEDLMELVTGITLDRVGNYDRRYL